MRYLLLIGLVFQFSFAQNEIYLEKINSFQEELNESYQNPETSPLSKNDLEKFKAHDFFPVDEDYRVVADFQIIEKPMTFLMKTSTSRLSEYEKYALASFEIKGKPYELYIYKSTKLDQDPEYIDYLFLPFTDETNGSTSYGGGRYIDLKIPNNDSIVIDFNKAYNPYCAYSKNYSCPIPPEENHLEVEVLAGIKASNL